MMRLRLYSYLNRLTWKHYAKFIITTNLSLSQVHDASSQLVVKENYDLFKINTPAKDAKADVNGFSIVKSGSINVRRHMKLLVTGIYEIGESGKTNIAVSIRPSVLSFYSSIIPLAFFLTILIFTLTALQITLQTKLIVSILFCIFFYFAFILFPLIFRFWIIKLQLKDHFKKYEINSGLSQ